MRALCAAAARGAFGYSRRPRARSLSLCRYNHAGNYTIGYWPAIDAAGTAYNGGIPQRGNLTKHLAQVATDVASTFPNPEHDGMISIDWEEWTPWLQFWPDAAPTQRWSAYANASFEHAGGDKALAIAQWNASSLKFMVETLRTVVKLRPKAKVAYCTPPPVEPGPLAHLALSPLILAPPSRSHC